MVKAEVEKTWVSGGLTKRVINIAPDKANQLMSYKAVRTYVTKKQAELGSDAKILVRGMNILRSTTLKGMDDDLMTEEQYDEYTQGKVEDNDKFKYFTNLQLTIVKPNKR
jgi:hypothetical protein